MDPSMILASSRLGRADKNTNEAVEAFYEAHGNVSVRTYFTTIGRKLLGSTQLYKMRSTVAAQPVSIVPRRLT